MTDSGRRIWRTAEQAEGQLFAVVTPNPDAGSFDADVLDTTGNRYVHLRGYRTVAFPNAVDAEPLKNLQAVMALQAAVA
jgi:hypothetical protein